MVLGQKDELQTATRTAETPQHQSDVMEERSDSAISKHEIDPASSEDVEKFKSLPVITDLCREESVVAKGSVMSSKLGSNVGTDVKSSAGWSPNDDHFFATSITRVNGDKTINAASAPNAPPLLKHHLFRAPRPPRKSKSTLGSAISALSPTTKTAARKRRLDEIDQELRDILLEDPESCVLEGSIAKLVLERLRELDEVKVVSHDIPTWGDTRTELEDEKHDSVKDKSRSTKAVSLAPTFVSLRLYDGRYPESERPLVRVTSGPHRGVVGMCFGVAFVLCYH